jgi:DNA-binding transcriptional regulator YiaG
VNETIDVRRQRAVQASWIQQRPSAFIEAVESRQFTGAYPYSTTLYIGGRITDFDMVDAGTIATVTASMAGGAATLTKANFTSAGLAIVNDERNEMNWSVPAKALFQHTADARPAQDIESHAKSAKSAGATLRVARLAGIQASFGLTAKALAEVLRITRPNLYKWLDASKDITPQGANRQRLNTIERLAKMWRERSDAPLSSVAHEPLGEGHTVLDMLTEEGLNEDTVATAFDALVEKLQGKPKTLSQRMAEAGFKRRPTYRSLPRDE